MPSRKNKQRLTCLVMVRNTSDFPSTYHILNSTKTIDAHRFMQFTWTVSNIRNFVRFLNKTFGNDWKYVNVYDYMGFATPVKDARQFGYLLANFTRNSRIDFTVKSLLNGGLQ